jgi:hypothetical protein
MKFFIDWLYNTQLSQLFQSVAWVIPTAQIIHLVFLSIIFASMAMFDLRLLGVAGTRHSTYALAQRFLPSLWWALPILLVTGLVLIVAEPNRQLQNSAFYLKMGLLVAVILVTRGITRAINKDPQGWDSQPQYRFRARAAGVVSLLCWVAIVACGRLIAYV